ncbi:MAG: YafY family protein [Coprobacillus sp.]
MKIERLIGIIMVLLQNKKVTATYLADKFEVSKRTIYRDIIDICLAGIPVLTIPGSQGGLMIDEDYKIDKRLFNEQELNSIIAGLSSLDSISSDQKYQRIMNKLFISENNLYTTSHMMMDLSSHYKDSLAPKIELLQQAIENTYKVTFHYYNKKGQRDVTVNPYFIVFKWSHWYILGFDNEKNEMRLFKLNRLWDLNITDKLFEMEDIPDDHYDFNQFFTDDIKVTILFDKSVEYQLIEEYGRDCYKELDNGRLLFEFGFTNKDYLLSWVLSFGNKAELIEPKEYRQDLKEQAKLLFEKY